MRKSLLHSRSGFTLVEVLIASAVLGAALVVMFGFHSQAVRANMNARRDTDCVFLAQTQMERVLTLPWTSVGRPTELSGGWSTPSMWDPLATVDPSSPVNGANNHDDAQGPSIYTLSWDVQDMDADGLWARIRVRCTYYDAAFGTYHGTTVSSFRFRDS